jgi:hypothetical protein
MTIWRMCFACWITKVPDTNTEYVIFIAFPRQHRLQGRASLLRHTHIASHVCCGNRKEWGLRFSLRCCWRFFTFVMWRCLNLRFYETSRTSRLVTQRQFPQVFKQIFSIKEMSKDSWVTFSNRIETNGRISARIPAWKNVTPTEWISVKFRILPPLSDFS